MTPEQHVSHARELLNNPLLQALAEAVEADAVNQLVIAEPGEHDKRQRLASEIRAIRAFVATIESIAAGATERTVKSVA